MKVVVWARAHRRTEGPRCERHDCTENLGCHEQALFQRAGRKHRLALQQDEPDDYVVATGTDYSVRDFVQFAFDAAGLDWERHVRLDERYLRPTEVDSLVGDTIQTEEKLHWKATVFVPELAKIMVEEDIRQLEDSTIDRPRIPDWPTTW